MRPCGRLFTSIPAWDVQGSQNNLRHPDSDYGWPQETHERGKARLGKAGTLKLCKAPCHTRHCGV